MALVASHRLYDRRHRPEVFKPAIRTEVADTGPTVRSRCAGPERRVRPPGQRLWHMFVEERLRRETAMSMQMFGSVVDIRMPYMDSEFIDVTMQVPPEMKIGDTIQSFILAPALPGLSSCRQRQHRHHAGRADHEETDGHHAAQGSVKAAGRRLSAVRAARSVAAVSARAVCVRATAERSRRWIAGCSIREASRR